MKDRLVLALNSLIPGRLQILKRPVAAIAGQFRMELFGVSAPIGVAEMRIVIESTILNSTNRTVFDLPFPPAAKAWTIGEYRWASGYRLFIETGTFYGATMEAVAPIFEKCYTVESSERIFKHTRRRLGSIRPNIEFFCGDSAIWLGEILRELTTPAIIWLDAHHSVPAEPGDPPSPLARELAHLERYLAKARHLILIDDARALDIRPEEFGSFCEKARAAGYVVTQRYDVWRFVPKEIFA